jgi:hypothetical protein
MREYYELCGTAEALAGLLLEVYVGRGFYDAGRGKEWWQRTSTLEAEGTANSADDYIVNDAGLTTHDA